MSLAGGWSCGIVAKLRREYKAIAQRIVLFANSPSPTTGTPMTSPTTSTPTTSPSSSPTSLSTNGYSPVLETKKTECQMMIRTCEK